MSSAFRASGCVIMKMISSTSSTSIIGVTLMSEFTPPELPAAIAMLVLLLLGPVGRGLVEQPAVDRLCDGRHDPDTRAARRFHRVLDLGVLQVVVGLEVQNLVLGPTGEDRAQLVRQRRVLDRAPVQEVLPVLVDAEDHLVVAFGAGVEILALGQGRL